MKQSQSKKASRDARDLLTESVTELLNSDTFKAALAFRKKLPHYSFRNVWLIFCQMPDATSVAGYRVWQSVGRQVRKGETSLAIVAPLIKRVEENGKKEKRLVGFKTARVFDISQTDGDELPELPECVLLTAEGENINAYTKQLETFATARGNPVSYQAMPGTAKGFFVPASGQVVVKAGMPALQTLKTLVHEVAHALAHGKGCEAKTRDVMELEAEATAYLVCDALGLDTAAYSFPYLAGWAEKPDTLLNAADRACRLADQLLEALDSRSRPRELNLSHDPLTASATGQLRRARLT